MIGPAGFFPGGAFRPQALERRSARIGDRRDLDMTGAETEGLALARSESESPRDKAFQGETESQRPTQSPWLQTQYYNITSRGGESRIGSSRMSLKDQIVAALRETARPLGAYDLIRALEPERGKLAPTTVYRALAALIEDRRVHRIESLNAYVACNGLSCARAPSDPTAFAICGECGSVFEHRDDALNASLEALAQRLSFHAAHSVIEVHGRCDACSGGAAPR